MMIILGAGQLRALFALSAKKCGREHEKASDAESGLSGDLGLGLAMNSKITRTL
jgi:hypothetical protein